MQIFTEQTSITGDKIVTLRRRVVDKLCKDNFFAISVISYALRKGKINYKDILTEDEADVIKASGKPFPPPPKEVCHVI